MPDVYLRVKPPCRLRSWIFVVLIHYFGLHLYFGPSAFAGCPDHEDMGPINYVPTLLTAPTSLALSGVGYIADGAVVVGQLIAVPVAICSVPVILIAAAKLADGIAHSASAGMNACARTVSRSVNIGELYIPGAGQAIYRGTKSWRCPVDF